MLNVSVEWPISACLVMMIWVKVQHAQAQTKFWPGPKTYDPSIGRQTGGGPIASRDLEAAARGTDGQFRPELTSGGLSWPRGHLQTTF